MREKIKTFFECFLVREVESKGKPSEGDVIGAFAFGFRKHGKSGKSNKQIARLVEILHEKFCLPIISQWEIDKAMKRNSCHAVIREHRTEGEYLDTLEVADQMVEKMEKKNWKKVVIVAHSLHVWRCMRILRKLGAEVIIPLHLNLIPFDPKSEQWWTKGPKRWFFKEIFIRLGSFLGGWI